jgi:hypothetical protein
MAAGSLEWLNRRHFKATLDVIERDDRTFLLQIVHEQKYGEMNNMKLTLWRTKRDKYLFFISLSFAIVVLVYVGFLRQ